MSLLIHEEEGFCAFSHLISGGEAFVLYRISFAGVAIILFACVSPCQTTSPSDPTQPSVAPGTEDNNPSPHESKRILFIIPNFKTSLTLQNYEPLTTSEKFKLASQDAFDPGTVALAALFGGRGQLTNSNRSFGQGVAGYSKYFGASYGDWFIGDYMTESVYPALLHQDPRYFRRSTGSGWSRLGYAMGQIFWTHRDSGGTQFNFSESTGKRNRGSNFAGLLRGQPNSFERSVEPQCATRRRHGFQYLKRVLAGLGTEIQVKTQRADNHQGTELAT